MNKITIVGAGRVGESTAQFLAAKNLCREIVLLDIHDGAARGAALDIQEVAPIFEYDTRLIGGVDHSHDAIHHPPIEAQLLDLLGTAIAFDVGHHDRVEDFIGR